MTIDTEQDDGKELMTPEQAREFLQEQIDRWSYLVTTYGFRFDVIWCPNGHGMPADAGRWCVGYTSTMQQYLEATIYFNLYICSQKSKEFLEETLVHELTHLLLAPMQADNSKDNTERCTTMVSRLFVGLRNTKEE